MPTGLATTLSVGPTSDDIVRFLRVRLSEGETSDAMDESLEGNIREKIAGRTSEICIAAMARIPSRRYQLIYIYSGFYLFP